MLELLMAEENAKLVYSTDKDVPRKEKPAKDTLQTALPLRQQRVTIRLDRKGRGGKAVTVIEGILLSLNEAQAFLKQSKSRLGTGGTLKDGAFEIQGDHRDAVIAMLTRMGYSPKRSGG